MIRQFKLSAVSAGSCAAFEESVEAAIKRILKIEGALIGTVKTFYSEGMHIAHISYQIPCDKEKDDDKQVQD